MTTIDQTDYFSKLPDAPCGKILGYLDMPMLVKALRVNKRIHGLIEKNITSIHAELTLNTPSNRSFTAQRVARTLLHQVFHRKKSRLARLVSNFRQDSTKPLEKYGIAGNVMAKYAAQDAGKDGVENTLKNWISAARFLHSSEGKAFAIMLRKLIYSGNITETGQEPHENYKSLIDNVSLGIINDSSKRQPDLADNPEEMKKLSTQLSSNLPTVVKKMSKTDRKTTEIFLGTPGGLVVARSARLVAEVTSQKRFQADQRVLQSIQIQGN